MDNNTVALAAIALAGTITTGFFALLSKLSRSIDKMTLSNDKIADEAKKRNGHLEDLVITTAKATQSLLDKPVNVQTVETQVVKEQK